MSPTPIEQSETELAALKSRLEKHDAEGAEIDKELAEATERARAARLTMNEIAHHAGVARPILYNALRRTNDPTFIKNRPGTKRPNTPEN